MNREKKIDTLEEELETLTEEALRPIAKAVGVENLITMHLFRAIYSPPLEKIRLIFESYMLLKGDEEKLELLLSDERISEEELEEVEKLYQVCLDLMETQYLRDNYSYYAIIPWSFSYDEVNDYLYWLNLKTKVYFRNFPMSPEQKAQFDLIIRNHYSKLPVQYWVYDFAKQALISWVTAKDIKNQFINYSMPIASKLMTALIEAVVSPDIWWETLNLFASMRRTEVGGETVK